MWSKNVVPKNHRDLVFFYFFKHFPELLLCNSVTEKCLRSLLGQIRVPEKPEPGRSPDPEPRIVEIKLVLPRNGKQSFSNNYDC